MDKMTGAPIENAYVICFTDIYPFEQHFNPGGANPHQDSLQITKSDKNGYFRVPPYNKFNGGWVEYRRVYFMKEGYIYANEYFQLYNKKNVLRKKFERYRPTIEIDLTKDVRIYLSNEEEIDMDDKGEWKEKVINGYLGLAWETQGYQSYLRDERITEYKKLEPFFRALLNIFNRKSASIQKTFTEAHLIDNWNSNLKEFNDDMK
ncbi:MAG: hypothetical protein MUP30_03790 [Deltaproteobacteria bacterium]|nr:hypothetical protein [Deltaproteobacteria bacterium]